MKYLLLITFLNIYSTISFCQEQGDTLFVALKEGIILFEKPYATSPAVTEVHFNSKIIVLDREKLDTIEWRVAHWLEVKTIDGSTGWAFGGYLNKQALPTYPFYSLRYFLPKLHERLPSKFETEYIKKGESEMEDIRTYVSGNDSSLTIIKSIWENGITEIQLYEWELHEMLNIIALSEWEGENVEFKLLKESAIPLNFDRFQWIAAFDDPEATIILEKLYPKGIRIIIDSLY